MKLQVSLSRVTTGQLKKGDRCLVEVDKNEYYTGTVKSSGLSGIKVALDDGSNAAAGRQDYVHVWQLPSDHPVDPKPLTKAVAKALIKSTGNLLSDWLKTKVTTEFEREGNIKARVQKFIRARATAKDMGSILSIAERMDPTKTSYTVGNLISRLERTGMGKKPAEFMRSSYNINDGWLQMGYVAMVHRAFKSNE